jgi:hypothetical protein
LNHKPLCFARKLGQTAAGNATTQTHYQIKASQFLLTRAKRFSQQTLHSVAAHRQPLDFTSDY